MSATDRVPLTKIDLTFWVPLFVDKSVCEVLASLKTNEWSDETLACDFLRKHIFKTIINQATDVENEFRDDNSDDGKSHYGMARQIRMIFSKAIRHVRQYQIGDNMVHIQLKIFTPLHGTRPWHHDEALVRWVKARIIAVMESVANQLAEENKIHGEVYKQFARQMKLINGHWPDQFAIMHVTADNDL